MFERIRQKKSPVWDWITDIHEEVMKAINVIYGEDENTKATKGFVAMFRSRMYRCSVFNGTKDIKK